MKLTFSLASEKQLSKFPKNIQRRILNKLVSPKLERLSGNLGYKIRVGEYRVIVDVFPNEIFVKKVGHRKNVYR